MRKIWGWLLLVFLAAACERQISVGCDLDVTVPDEWKIDLEYEEEAQELSDSWWTLFNDPILNELEEMALSYNKDLLIACERILEARAQAGIAFSKRLPQLFLFPSYNRSGQLINLSEFSPLAGDQRSVFRSYVMPATLSYEVDFWGKFLHGDRAAKARLVASCWGYWNIMNSLTTEVANLYLTLRTLDEEINFLNESVRVRNDTYEINKARVRAGLDPEIDLSRALLEVARAEQELQDSLRLRQEAENELAQLVGSLASDFSIAHGNLPENNPHFTPDLPASLLLRRPDVWEKSLELKAALEEVGVSIAQFFPEISLSGTLGFLSPQLNRWFTWLGRYWAVDATASQPLFDGGNLIYNWKEKKALYRVAAHSYQKQVEIAFKEVEDAFSAINYRRKEFEAQSLAADAAIDTAYLARQQFNAGLINFLQVADAEKTQLDVEKLAIRLKGSQYLATIFLIRALGGGFEDPGPPNLCFDDEELCPPFEESSNQSDLGWLPGIPHNPTQDPQE